MSEAFLRNPITGVILLAAAAGGPYMWYETEVGKQGQTALSSASQGVSGLANTVGLSSSTPAAWNPTTASGYGQASGSLHPQLARDPFRPQNTGLDQVPIVSLAEVLRFDISPAWVLARFPRVSTLLSNVQLDGMRAPLITGSTPSDIAGTITYYFDRYKQLKRISLQGTLGDPTRFVAELQQNYQMSQEPSLGGSLYLIKWNGQPTSILHIAPSAVVYNDLPYGRFSLLLELNQAGLEYGLSPESQQLIDAGRQAFRW